jgi:menaquinone-dependent protoporphyrinogen IX oxidase
MNVLIVYCSNEGSTVKVEVALAPSMNEANR